ncbi:MAG TPA: amino acid racemase [Rummeliibacillus sp.]|uniref:aspartate/glutamate racemase family protein n=1 Tax=Rummeliibacillus pycnus TaxID=101070 RepID=UPI002C1E9355|nr:amino acid racemase [Rummeliibacillus sp.]
MEKKVLGIIGGVGPLATMLLGESIVRRTKAFSDQEHMHFIIDNDTRIPDRTAYILDHSKPNPLPVMVEDANKLADAGADMIVIPCNTAHNFYDDLQSNSKVPVLHMIRETAKKARQLNANRVGVLATIGTLTSNLYQEALMDEGIEPVIPDEVMQQDIMTVIYDYVKAGKKITSAQWQPIEAAMKNAGCDHIILGCTELSVVNRELSLDDSYIDALIVLADCAITSCGYELLD